jgi:hypothetical protein
MIKVALKDNSAVVRAYLDSSALPFQVFTGNKRCAGTAKKINNNIAFL